MRRLAVLLGFVLVTTACGGGDEADDPTTSTAPTATTEATSTTSTAPTSTTEATSATTTTEPAPPEPEEAMQLSSPVFDHEGAIPARYSCDGEDISPPLTLKAIPPGAGAMVLIMDDPDAPVGVWDHWVEYDIPVLEVIAEDAVTLGTKGLNSWGRDGYGGPCPPGGTHRYIFTVYILEAAVGLEPGATKGEVLAAIADHVLAEATLMGTYSR
ncbi:MAG: YbhB/YbcL family Raf kinase inhibitor-like protein [Acidimicrobiia bacterium]